MLEKEKGWTFENRMTPLSGLKQNDASSAHRTPSSQHP